MKHNMIFVSLVAGLGFSLQAAAQGGCSTGAWASVTAEGNVTATAEARAGYEDNCVLVANKPAGEPANHSGFVRYDFAQGEPRVRGRMIIDPSGMDFAGSGGEARGRILDVRKPDAEPSPRLLFHITVRDNNTVGAPQYQVNMQWVGDDIGGGNRARGRCTNPWVDVPAGPSTIEWDYVFESDSSANDGECRFFVDGTQVDEVTGLNNGALNTGSLRVGLIRGFQTSFSGEFVGDAVELRRQNGSGCVSGVGACP